MRQPGSPTRMVAGTGRTLIPTPQRSGTLTNPPDRGSRQRTERTSGEEPPARTDPRGTTRGLGRDLPRPTTGDTEAGRPASRSRGGSTRGQGRARALRAGPMASTGRFHRGTAGADASWKGSRGKAPPARAEPAGSTQGLGRGQPRPPSGCAEASATVSGSLGCSAPRKIAQAPCGGNQRRWPM